MTEKEIRVFGEAETRYDEIKKPYKFIGITSFVLGMVLNILQGVEDSGNPISEFEPPTERAIWGALLTLNGFFLMPLIWFFRSLNLRENLTKEVEKKINEELEIEEKRDEAEKKIKAIQEAKRIEIQKRKEKAELIESQNKILQDLDKDGNGIVDDIEDNDDFNLLLKKHQKDIVEINRDYVREFVKVSNYLKTKKKNIQLIFNSIKDTSNQNELDNYVGILKNEVHSYNLVLFNSLNMIVSIIQDDMITFYEIHDSFDKLNMFNSNWESEVTKKLDNIGNGLNDLMFAINEMGQNIIQEIGHLSYVTEGSNEMLANKLQEVDSSIQANNLLTGIQTYQMYKINKNTKSLKN